jgi:hypothetical protein
MRVAVPAAYARGKLGELRLRLDWARISDVLDQAASGDGRMLAILDREGRVIAASKQLRARGLLLTDTLAGWRTAPGAAAVAVRDGQALDQSRAQRRPAMCALPASAGRRWSSSRSNRRWRRCTAWG